MATMPAINTRFRPIYDRTQGATTMKQPDRPNLTEVIEKVRKLKELQRTTGFHTTRSIGALLASLSPDDLVLVSEALHSTPSVLSQR